MRKFLKQCIGAKLKKFKKEIKKIFVKNNKEYNPIVFINNPINDEEEDLIGVSGEARRIENAIDEGANIIGIIGDYGSGKSSLIEILKRNFATSICINMWNSVTNCYNSLEITKNFIFQLAIGKNQRFAQYISKRISKNYNVLSVAISTLKYWKCGLFSALFFCMYKICLDLPNNIYETSLYNSISDYTKVRITNIGLADIIKCLYGISIDFRYIYLLISMILLFKLLYNNVMAVVSAGVKKGETGEDVNDIYGIYLEVAKEISEIKPKIKYLFVKRKNKVLVIIEDLDRIDKKDDVRTFIKEIYKFNNVLPEKIKKKIVYLIAVKQEECLYELLESKEGTKEEKEKIFSKIFSYKTVLNPIHYSDYNKVLLELLKQKEGFLKDNMGIELKDELPKEFYFITKGRNLTIREIKDRLNRSMDLYDSIKKKSNTEDKAIDFVKCAVVAYLENAYPNETKKLIMDDHHFSNVINDSYKIKQNSTLKNSTKITQIAYLIDLDDKNQHMNLNDDFIKELAEMIVSGLIDDDFRMYFYNYPKGQRIKTISEKYVEDLLLYDNDNDNNVVDEDIIQKALDNNPNVIINCFKRRINEELLLPNNVLESSILFKQALDNYKDNLIKLMQEEIKWKSENVVESSRILTNICKYNYDIGNVLEEYAQILYIEIQKLDKIELLKARKEIIKASGEYVKYFSALFVNNNMPLIDETELDLIRNTDTKIELINVKLINEESFTYLTKFLNSEKLNEKNFESVKHLYYKMGSNIKLEKFAGVLLEFMSKNNQYDNALFEHIYNGFTNNRNIVEENKIVEYLNTLPQEVLNIDLLTMIDGMKLRCKLNNSILHKLKENGLCNTYWINMIVYNQCDKLDIKNNVGQNLNILNNIIEIIGTEITNFRKVIIEEQLIEEYEKIFKDEYPFVTKNEMEMLYSATDLIKIIDFSKVSSDNLENIIERFNVLYTSKEDLLTIIKEFTANVNGDISIIKSLVENMVWKEAVIKELSLEDRDIIYNCLKTPLKLSSPVEAFEFLKRINFLIERVEEQVYIGIDDGMIDKNEYIKFINGINMPTDETIKTITVLKLYYAFNENITSKLYEQKYYEHYIISKILLCKKLALETEKVSLENYVNVYNSCDIVNDIMIENKEFIQAIMDNDLYRDIISNEKLKPLYKIAQSIRFIEYLIERLNEKEFMEYLEMNWTFSSEKDSEDFQKLICKDNYIKYIEEEKYYKIVYNKLVKPAQRGQLTKRRNIYLETKQKD